MTPTQRITVYKMDDSTFKGMARIEGLHWCTYDCDHLAVRLNPERDDQVFDKRSEAIHEIEGMVSCR